MDVLIDRQFRDYNYVSRYQSFPIYYHTLDFKYVYGTTAQLNKETISVAYKVKRGDTWDSISLEYYNDPTKYWVLCDFNSHIDSFIEPEEGAWIRIPSLSDIRFQGV